MSYQVIARKFRPQSFDEFVGQEHVTQTLINALKSERFPHAILLTGPRGTGKTTTARIIAKTLLCKDPQNYSPCGKCQACLDVTEGKHLDVLEIDGASNNGVDHIRELRETVGFMPSSGSHKVYIIDEVHMLSTSAFNALLKTLEEPPEHVIFIFATTEVQKIPATILSRCQRFDFRNHSLTDIKNHLAKICQQENIEFEEDALWTIAKHAKGSIRDSLTLLDQLISFSEKKLSLATVMSSLGLTDRHLLITALKAITNNDSDLMFETLHKFKSTGYDPMIFAEEFMELLRNSLLIKMKCHKKQKLNISDHEVEALEQLAPQLAIEQIHLLFDVCLSGLQRLTYSSDARLALEILLFKLLSLPRLTQKLGAEAPKATAPTHTSASLPPVPTQQEAIQKTPEKESLPASSAPKAQEAKPPQTEATTDKQDSMAKTSVAMPLPNPTEQVGKTWEEFVHAVKQTNGFLGALLEHTSICEQDDKCIRLGLPEKMSFLFDKLSEKKNLARTENFLQSFWSDQRKIEVTLLEKDHLHESLSPKAMAENARQQKEKKEADSVEAHPLVRAAETVFKGSITKVSVTNTTPKKENSL